MRGRVSAVAAMMGLSLIAGCDKSPEHVPATSASASAPARPQRTETPAAVPATTRLTLGPDGLGKLKLGMSFDAARKSGLLAADGPATTPAGCNSDYVPKSAGKADAPVFFNGGQGLVSFTAYPGLRTPEGIKLGSTAKDVLRAYPDWISATEADLTGRGYAKVPGGPGKAVYNIAVYEGKVVHINLQLTDQGCYE